MLTASKSEKASAYEKGAKW